MKKHIDIDKVIFADDIRLTSSLVTASGDVLPCVGVVQVPVPFSEFELSFISCHPFKCIYYIYYGNQYSGEDQP